MTHQPEMRPDPTTAAGWRVRASCALMHLSPKDRKRVLIEFAEDASKGPWKAVETPKMANGTMEWVVTAFIDHHHLVVTTGFYFTEAEAFAIRDILNRLHYS